MKAESETKKTSCFDDKTFFVGRSRLNPYRDYKRRDTYTSNKIVNIITFDRFQLNFDCIERSIVIGLRQKFSLSFVPEKRAAYIFSMSH